MIVYDVIFSDFLLVWELTWPKFPLIEGGGGEGLKKIMSVYHFFLSQHPLDFSP